MEEIGHVVEAFHRLLAIDEEVPAYPRSRRERPMLEVIAASHCVRKDGLAASPAYAVERTHDDLVGQDAALRDALRTVIGGLVKIGDGRGR